MAITRTISSNNQRKKRMISMVTIIWNSGCTASSQLSFSNMLANVQRWMFSSWLKMSFTIHYRHPPKLTIGKYRKTHVQPVYACIFHDLKRLFKVIEIRTNSEHLSFIRSYVLMLNWSFSLFFFCTCIFSVGLPCEADGSVGGGGRMGGGGISSGGLVYTAQSLLPVCTLLLLRTTVHQCHTECSHP